MAVGKPAEQQIGFAGATVPHPESEAFPENLGIMLVHSRYLAEPGTGVLAGLSWSRKVRISAGFQGPDSRLVLLRPG